MKSSYPSRLSKRREKHTKNVMVLTLFGIVVLIVFLIFYGLPLLINFTLFVGKNSHANSKNDGAETESSFIVPPTLSVPFDATSSASIIVAGNAANNQKIRLYVNDMLNSEKDVRDDGTFSFDSVSLKEGDNTIEAQSVEGKNKSKFTDPVHVQYMKKPPQITIDTPSDGQTFSKDDRNITIKGKSDDTAQITVNGFWPISDADGSFHYDMTLKDGDNQITVKAIDKAGNTSEKTIKVTYNP